jgi:hypothetical protein
MRAHLARNIRRNAEVAPPVPRCGPRVLLPSRVVRPPGVVASRFSATLPSGNDETGPPTKDRARGRSSRRKDLRGAIWLDRHHCASAFCLGSTGAEPVLTRRLGCHSVPARLLPDVGWPDFPFRRTPRRGVRPCDAQRRGRRHGLPNACRRTRGNSGPRRRYAVPCGLLIKMIHGTRLNWAR